MVFSADGLSFEEPRHSLEVNSYHSLYLAPHADQTFPHAVDAARIRLRSIVGTGLGHSACKVVFLKSTTLLRRECT